MINIPVIVISSPSQKSGSSVLALNLAGALWNDGYNVGLYSSQPQKIENFLQKRADFCNENNTEIFAPQQIKNIENITELSAVVADVSAEDYKENEAVFNHAHTLITPLNNKDAVQWQPSGEYLNFIWKIKKNLAAQGIMYLNWIVVPYLKNKDDFDFSSELSEQAKRYGFRIAPAIYYRDEYMHVADGYCAADLQKGVLAKKMTFGDVYARREILKLTDFIWQKS